MFERHGYANARVEDITEEAGYAVGSFYTYFRDKEDVFHHVLGALSDDGSTAAQAWPEPGGDFAAEVATGVSRFWRRFDTVARLWAVVEEASLRDDLARELLLDRWSTFRATVVPRFATAQQAGAISPDVDVTVTVWALGAMSSWLAALDKVYGHRHQAAIGPKQISQVWLAALGAADAESTPALPVTAARGQHRSPAQPAPSASTAKSLATRRALLDGGRSVFRGTGLAEAGVRELAAASGVSVGTFYKSVDSKESLLEAILVELGKQVALPDHDGVLIHDWIAASKRNFVLDVQRDPGLWRTVAEAALTSPSFREVLNRRRRRHAEITAGALHELQAAGRIASPVDPTVAAITMNAMVERCAHLWYVLGDRPPSVPAAVRSISRIWVRVLRPADRAGSGAR